MNYHQHQSAFGQLVVAAIATITIMVIYKSNLPMRIKKLLKMRKAVKMTIKKITTKKTPATAVTSALQLSVYDLFNGTVCQAVSLRE